MLISTAYAASATAGAAATDAAGAAAQGPASFLVSLMPLFLVVVIFYFFLVRPQQKRMAEFQKLVSELRRGDRVVTTGGLIGTIHRVEANNPDLLLEIAEGVRVRVQRNAIAEVLAKTGSISDDTPSEKKSD